MRDMNVRENISHRSENTKLFVCVYKSDEIINLCVVNWSRNRRKKLAHAIRGLWKINSKPMLLWQSTKYSCSIAFRWCVCTKFIFMLSICLSCLAVHLCVVSANCLPLLPMVSEVCAWTSSRNGHFTLFFFFLNLYTCLIRERHCPSC